ncbi:MAG: ATP-binding protein [Acidimicrobiia bacterium]
MYPIVLGRARSQTLGMEAMPPLDFSRRRTGRIFAGVAGGLADMLGVRDSYVRAAFITLAAVWGLGLVIYLGLWLVSFDRVEDREVAPADPGQPIGLAAVFAGVMLLLSGLGWWPNTGLVLTITALSFGTAALVDSGKRGPLEALLDPGTARAGRIRLLVGVGLLMAGLTLLTTAVGEIFQFQAVVLAVALTGVGLVVAFGPWVRRLLEDLAEERRERIRQEERAEMAAHLHDSVLQTLALIQRSDDSRRIAMLARHQEAELREWLYGTAPLAGVDMVSTALKQAAERIEKDHQVPVEVITVGDVAVDEKTGALVAAATEAMVNAAKHSGADRVSVYMEVDEDGSAEVFVTDHGKGFDPEATPPGRRGIALSIRGRMSRAGGSAEIVSEPGEGTEVVLRLPGGEQ